VQNVSYEGTSGEAACGVSLCGCLFGFQNYDDDDDDDDDNRQAGVDRMNVLSFFLYFDFDGRKSSWMTTMKKKNKLGSDDVSSMIFDFFFPNICMKRLVYCQGVNN